MLIISKRMGKIIIKGVKSFKVIHFIHKNRLLIHKIIHFYLMTYTPILREVLLRKQVLFLNLSSVSTTKATNYILRVNGEGEL